MLDLKSVQFLFQILYLFPEILQKQITTLFFKDPYGFLEIRQLTFQRVEMRDDTFEVRPPFQKTGSCLG
jgi:transposase